MKREPQAWLKPCRYNREPAAAVAAGSRLAIDGSLHHGLRWAGVRRFETGDGYPDDY
jgi:hypothetical protein